MWLLFALSLTVVGTSMRYHHSAITSAIIPRACLGLRGGADPVDQAAVLIEGNAQAFFVQHAWYTSREQTSSHATCGPALISPFLF